MNTLHLKTSSLISTQLLQVTAGWEQLWDRDRDDKSVSIRDLSQQWHIGIALFALLPFSPTHSRDHRLTDNFFPDPDLTDTITLNQCISRCDALHLNEVAFSNQTVGYLYIKAQIKRDNREDFDSNNSLRPYANCTRYKDNVLAQRSHKFKKKLFKYAGKRMQQSVDKSTSFTFFSDWFVLNISVSTKGSILLTLVNNFQYLTWI